MRRIEQAAKGLRQSQAWRYREQFLYGHREILLDFAGLPRGFLLRGRVQHGWDVWFEGSHGFRGLDSRPGWQWVWSGLAVRRALRRGIPKVVAIGAPWLYLEKMRAAAEIHTRPPSSVGSSQPTTLFMPAHYGPFSSVSLHRFHSTTIAAELDPSRTTVLLHGYDFLRPDIRDVYERMGIETECLGYPGYSPRGMAYSADVANRVRFLARLHYLMRRHDQVATDFMGSHVFFASSLDVPIGYFPLPERMWNALVQEHGKEDQRLFHGMARLESRWREGLTHCFGRSEALSDLGRLVLGNDHVLPPEELREILRVSDQGLPEPGTWENPDVPSWLLDNELPTGSE